jgi:hypothetical protein
MFADDCFDMIAEDESNPPALLAGGGWISREWSAGPGISTTSKLEQSLKLQTHEGVALRQYVRD